MIYGLTLWVHIILQKMHTTATDAHGTAENSYMVSAILHIAHSDVQPANIIRKSNQSNDPSTSSAWTTKPIHVTTLPNHIPLVHTLPCSIPQHALSLFACWLKHFPEPKPTLTYCTWMLRAPIHTTCIPCPAIYSHCQCCPMIITCQCLPTQLDCPPDQSSSIWTFLIGWPILPASMITQTDIKCTRPTIYHHRLFIIHTSTCANM